jgi:hypothetical protein
VGYGPNLELLLPLNLAEAQLVNEAFVEGYCIIIILRNNPYVTAIFIDDVKQSQKVTNFFKHTKVTHESESQVYYTVFNHRYTIQCSIVTLHQLF